MAIWGNYSRNDLRKAKKGGDIMNYNIFINGSVWLRADFHLHTNQDKEFSYNGSRFINDYIQGLKSADIHVGVITNHNKFDINEFKALRKAALKEEIFLLPGIELSVKDGSNGIHTLVVFNDVWLFNQENKDYINDFLNTTFSGQSNYFNENARSNHDLLATIQILNVFEKDYFLIFAHVESPNGLWGGLGGGRIKELGKNDSFKKTTLGFQKVRTRDDRKKVVNWLDNWYPAEVEGSDCKAVGEIGQGEACFLKIGGFTFEAVKYALLDHRDRVAKESHNYKHSYIRSISFEGGVLNGKTVNFSPELDSLIGIRGSGKSSILEAVRYVLDIPFGEKALDKTYKEALVKHTFGSGGKAVICAMDRHSKEYEIRRILNETAEVYMNGSVQPGVKIRETILHKPIYFGQKDLSSTGEGFEKDLVEKLVGEKLVDIRHQIDEQKGKVCDTVDRLDKLSNIDELKKEYEEKKQDAEFRLKFFKEYGVEEKLHKQVDFDNDLRKIEHILKFVKGYLQELSNFIDRFENEFESLRIYTSTQNQEFFNVFFAMYDKLKAEFETLKKLLTNGQEHFKELQTKRSEFLDIKNGLKEEFAKIIRKLDEEIKGSSAQSINPDEFLRLQKIVDESKIELNKFSNQQLNKKTLRNVLIKELSLLNELWHKEFQIIQSELDRINKNQPALRVETEYKGDKEAFFTYMKSIYRGSGIRGNKLQKLVYKFPDFGAMYLDFDNKDIWSSPEELKKYFADNLKDLLTWQPPNRFTIKYHSKELKHHSLGQRASALIMFVLSQRENDVVIIDQPEDDLDNQTIYEDVIKLIRGMKKQTQFIFATHNANFPVLGDAEQIHSCCYSDEKIELASGSIDNPILQKKIVDIMEGGEEAFNRRKKIYQIWNPKSL